MKLDSKIPAGPLSQKWTDHKFNSKLVNPANKRKYDIIIVGTGLAGASAAASFAELGYNVKSFCFQDSPRRAHSIAAQGGINAAKNYQNDGDSVHRLFYDTIKGGDYRSREANVHRLAEVSNNIIDQCVAQGVPFAREYGGMLDNRSFGGALVSRTFYARGQTGQQLLLGAYSALSRQIGAGKVEMHNRTEMLEVVLDEEGHAAGIVTRDLVTGQIESHAAHAVVLATGGYSNVFFLSTNAMGSNATAAWRAHRKGALFANPCYTQIHPTCIPVHGKQQSKLTLMSESLRNDGRVWVPRKAKDPRKPKDIPESERYYYLEERYPTFGNLVPRDVASRNAKYVCDDGLGVGDGRAVYLDFAESIQRLGRDTVEERYGNLFDMYHRITDDNPYETPMMIYPAPHYTMGGLWVDYNLMTNIPGLYAIGEANFSDHGSNRLGASALMQGLADGYFVLPYTIGDYLTSRSYDRKKETAPEFKQAEADVKANLKSIVETKGSKTPDELHKELGDIMIDKCGMSRTEEGLKEARTKIQGLQQEFKENMKVIGGTEEMNITLEKANRLSDYLELGELMVVDALDRSESCGGHFREESKTSEGEALRKDEDFSYVAAWEYKGEGKDPELHKEELKFENVKLTQRSYK